MANEMVSALSALALGDYEQVVAATALDEFEVTTIRDGVMRLPTPLAELAERLLDDWPSLGPGERIAALWMLAEALAFGTSIDGAQGSGRAGGGQG
jgi:hypothetical protein